MLLKEKDKMFLKITGFIIIMITTYISGLYLAARTSFRIYDLEQLKKAITIFKGEVVYSSAPLGSLFKEISERTSGVISILFDLASKEIEKRSGEALIDIWAQVLGEVSKHSYFNTEDMEYIYSFGRTLGYADKGQQSDNARLLIEYVENTQSLLRDKKISEERLYKSLGIMCGLMISLVLL